MHSQKYTAYKILLCSNINYSFRLIKTLYMNLGIKNKIIIIINKMKSVLGRAEVEGRAVVSLG